MNRRRVMAGMAAGMLAAASLLLGGCDFGPPARTYRYKLSIEMETPDGPKRAFNVVEVKWEERKGTGGTRSITTVRGEALYLDLGPGRRPLVALLTSRVRPTDQPGQARSRCWGPSAPYCWRKIYDYDSSDPTALSRQRGARPLAVSDLPDLVTFEDPSDPRTVMEVDPAAPDKALGAGVSFGAVTLEITGEPLTTGIEKRLGWLVGLKTNLAGQRTVSTNTLDARLSSYDFQMRDF